jgi:hypothetical protein
MFEVGATEVRIAKVRVPEVNAPQIGASQIGTPQITFAEIAADQAIDVDTGQQFAGFPVTNVNHFLVGFLTVRP